MTKPVALGGVASVHAPDRVLLEVGDLDGIGLDAEQLCRERLYVGLRYPGRPEIGIDVAGQHVFGCTSRSAAALRAEAGPAASASASLARRLPDK